MSPDTPNAPPPTRRRLIGGAAWAVPVMAASAAAPAMAASCSAHRVRTAAGITYSDENLSGSGRITSTTFFDAVNTRASSTTGNNAWQMHADTALSHTLLTFAFSMTFPYRVTWAATATGIAGWTRSVVVTTSPNLWTYTWTAGSPLLPRTMLATTPLTSTSATAARSLQLPTFFGSVPNADVVAWRPVGTLQTGNPWTYPLAYTSTYQFTAGSGCAPGIRSYSRTGSITLQHTA